MRIVFMGTPELAKVCLEAVLRHPAAEVVGVFTQVDKPKGRGMRMIPSPVKELAVERGIPVYQPTTFKNEACLDLLKALDPEVIIVAAYGKILPQYVLDYPKYGCMNAHGSLLPKYRGASPIQRAIMDGETETGITAMRMDAGIDTGDMYFTYPCPIAPEDDFGTVHDRLAVLAGEAMCHVIDTILDGTLESYRKKQPEDGASYAAKIEKEDTILDFTRGAREIWCQIRGLSPAPGGLTHTPDGKLLKFVGVAPECGRTDADGEPGTVVDLTHGVTVVCGDGGTITATYVVPEGKSRMAAADYIRGRKLHIGDVLR